VAKGLTLPGGAAHARLLGLGEHRPARVVTNDEVARGLATPSDDEWIRARTGIASRRIAGEDESVVSMAADAAGKALAQAGVPARDVDLVLLATCTMPTPLPQGAPQVAARLGCRPIGAVDVGGACAAFCYALAMAADAVRAGSARHVVVVGSERFSDLLDWSDRGSCILFGDVAAAAVVGPSETAGIGPVAWGSDGAKSDLVRVDAETDFFRMDGPAVFRWAATELAPVARRACTLAGVEPEDLDVVVPHQANLRIVDAVARGLGATNAAVARDVVDTGNTSAASVPLALARLVREGAAKPGDLALLLAFGAGLAYAGQVVRVP
jgi:3-oxoacyl-[acyl-carrier-protein] synthase-3